MIGICKKPYIRKVYISLKGRTLSKAVDQIGLGSVQRLDGHIDAVLCGQFSDNAGDTDQLNVCILPSHALRHEAALSAAEDHKSASESIHARKGGLEIDSHLIFVVLVPDHYHVLGKQQGTAFHPDGGFLHDLQNGSELLLFPESNLVELSVDEVVSGFLDLHDISDICTKTESHAFSTPFLLIIQVSFPMRRTALSPSSLIEASAPSALTIVAETKGALPL